MKKSTFSFISLIILSINLCLASPKPEVFRCVLDETSRALVISWGDSIFAAYNTQNGQLVKFWKGKINFRGEVYTSEKVVQPKSMGVYLLNNQPASHIFAFEDSANKYQFYSYQILENKVLIKHQLNKRTTVLETIDLQPSPKKGFQLNRKFALIDNTQSNPILLKVTLFGLSTKSDFIINTAYQYVEAKEVYIDTKKSIFQNIINIKVGSQSVSLSHNINF